MSIIQKLSQIASQVPDAYQQDLLAYAHDMLNEVSEPVVNPDVEQEREQKLQQLTLDRYISFKKHPETAIAAEESSRRLKEKYGFA